MGWEDPARPSIEDAAREILRLSDLLDEKPGDPGLRHSRAVAYRAAGELVCAISDLLRAVEKKPSDQRLWKELREIYAQAGLEMHAGRAAARIEKLQGS